VTLRAVPLNLHQLLERVALLPRRSARSGGAIVRRYDPSLPPILATRTAWCRSSTTSCATRSRRWPSGGRSPWTTRVSLDPLFAKVDLGHGQRSMVEVQVIDDGRGHPSRARAALHPFFTTKDKGLGLGLALCHRISRSTRGAIQVASEAGKGTPSPAFLPIAR
jgi:two-component system nitrogen regulation sensor histidine kinase GlnL